jgi:hypothetical protein
VVIDNLDVVRVMPVTPEADAPLIVDPDAHLAGVFAFEDLEPVARRVPQVLEGSGRIQLP